MNFFEYDDHNSTLNKCDGQTVGNGMGLDWDLDQDYSGNGYSTSNTDGNPTIRLGFAGGGASGDKDLKEVNDAASRLS